MTVTLFENRENLFSTTISSTFSTTLAGYKHMRGPQPIITFMTQTTQLTTKAHLHKSHHYRRLILSKRCNLDSGFNLTNWIISILELI